MTTNFVPKVSGQGSLGYSNRRWDKLHVEEVDCTGEISASAYQGDGSQLTGITATATSMGGPMTAHIIPDSNAAYDLGNAEYKIRHLFLSDNSLWVGDQHKISIVDGKMSFKKRDGIPYDLTDAIMTAQGGGLDLAAAATTAGLPPAGTAPEDNRASYTVDNLTLHEVHALAAHFLPGADPHSLYDPASATDFKDNVVELPREDSAGDPTNLQLGTMIYDLGENNVKVVVDDGNGNKIWRTLSFV